MAGIRPRRCWMMLRDVLRGGRARLLLLPGVRRWLHVGPSISPSIWRSRVCVGVRCLISVAVQAFARAQKAPNWPEQDPSVSSLVSPDIARMEESKNTPSPSPKSALSEHFDFLSGVGSLHGIGLPIHVYPLYENGFRAHRGQSITENNKESAHLYAEFAKVAEKTPAAWSYGKPAETEESIGTVSKGNRMICFPCRPPPFGID